MNRPRPFPLGTWSTCLLILFLLAVALPAQLLPKKDYRNFETPQQHPVEVATLGTGEGAQDVLLICNTPDNSVEIRQVNSPWGLIQRVRTGLGPVTVRWFPELGRFFTCDFDGDSVTTVALNLVNGQPVATLQRIDYVGDEPSDIGISPDGLTATITLSSRSAVTLRMASNMAAVIPEFILQAPNPNNPNLPLAMKAPRALRMLPDGRAFILNFMGGADHVSLPGFRKYDMDLYYHDVSLPATPGAIGGMGTTNQAMAINADANKMIVVGSKARNLDAVGVANVKALPLGFVESWLWVVDITAGQVPSVAAEAPPAVTPAPLFRSINLNRDYSLASTTPLPRPQRISRPLDVLIIDDANAPSGIGRVVVTGFQSNKVSLLKPDATKAGGWAVSQVTIPVTTGYSVAGPSGVAYSPRATDPSTPMTPGLLFVRDHLSNSLSIINPNGTTPTHVMTLPLGNDPTPTEIRTGRRFLYDANFTSGNAMVACESCHIFGRTDALPWDLGDLNMGAAIQQGFHDQNGFSLQNPPPPGQTFLPNFPTEKGPMVTQTLQGLVNFRVNDAAQFLLTNAPYHWRGDKADFTDFNEAFVNLQGMPNIGTSGDPKGLTDADMRAYRSFVFTIVHPPNPEQPLNRRPTGSLTGSSGPTGSLGGMKTFHEGNAVNGRSCVDCHQLPDGSTNTSTLQFSVPKTISMSGAQAHPFETAAIRNVRQRESALHSDFTANITHMVGSNGLLHSGDPLFIGVDASINTFIQTVFPFSPQDLNNVVEFVRSFDTGVGPVVGFPWTVDPTNIPAADAAASILETEVLEANAEGAAYVRAGGQEKGYWFDVTTSPPAWREEGTNTLISRTQLLNSGSGTDSVVILIATPLGASRRWASATGVRTPISDTANPPAAANLLAMAPNTFHEQIFNFTGNLHWPNPPVGSSIWALRHLQNAVLQSPQIWGVTSRHHEPPRRFRVSGDNIRPGAKLLLGMNTYLSPPANPLAVIELDLYPTRYTDGNGKQIWETRQELDGTMTMVLLNGGPYRQEVVDVFLRTPMANPSLLNPAQWNNPTPTNPTSGYHPTIWNEDGTIGPSMGNWQRLTVQDVR